MARWLPFTSSVTPGPETIEALLVPNVARAITASDRARTRVAARTAAPAPPAGRRRRRAREASATCARAHRHRRDPNDHLPAVGVGALRYAGPAWTTSRSRRPS